MEPSSSRPRRLHHEVPPWVDRLGTVFHIRIRADRDNPEALCSPGLGPALLDSVLCYADRRVWWPRLVLLMPDHLHALLSFAPEVEMGRAVGAWKSWNARALGIRWQHGFFDHRIRNEESLAEKAEYILNNPVVKGVCARPEEWPWVVIEGRRRG
ncbi:MAG: transposase [Thermoanaerobaculaceae bacterium]